MRLFKCLFVLILTIVSTLFVTACTSSTHNPDDVKSQGAWTSVEVKYNEITLNWENSYFIHGDYTIEIPNDWRVLLSHQYKADYNLLNKHDIKYQYERRLITLYSGQTSYETRFKDLDYKPPGESVINFNINVTGIDIDSKVLIITDFINSVEVRYYYFKYDFDSEYDNYCYFQISEDAVNKLKSGSHNEIRLSLQILTHYDGSKSFKVKTENGITETGYYSPATLFYNPDYAEAVATGQTSSKVEYAYIKMEEDGDYELIGQNESGRYYVQVLGGNVVEVRSFIDGTTEQDVISFLGERITEFERMESI